MANETAEWVDVDLTPWGWTGYGREAIGNAIAALITQCEVVRVLATRHQLLVRLRDDSPDRVECARKAVAECAPKELKERRCR